MSNKFRVFLAAFLVLLFCAAPAHADPVSSTIVAISSFVAANASAIALAVSIGTTLLGLILKPKLNSAEVSGVKTSTSTGGVTAQTFVIGTYATGGHLAAPLMSYGTDNGTPNAFLVYVVMLGSIPGQGMSRLIINDDYAPIGDSLVTIGGSSTQGYPIQGIYDGNAWIRYHDGTQTTADPLLVEKFSDYPDRPWGTSFIGAGKPYAVLVFKYNQDVLNSPPQLRFEIAGIPLYDPRYDSTVGGSGSQRWDDKSTWVGTDNIPVMIYNIHRGIELPDGSRWGGKSEAADLPLDNWFDAMNEADVEVDNGQGGTEPQYAGGIEVSVDQKPIDVMQKLMTCCNAQQVESGGVWKIRIGGPGMPVLFMTDDDILVDQDQTENLFPGLDDSNNAIQGTYPDPDALWESTDSPPIYNSDWEAEDDGQQLITNVDFPCVFSPAQVQRIMGAVIADARRFRKHSFNMGPEASILEPLDSIAWTSAREGYTNKVFEVYQTVEGMRTVNVNLAVRERDSADFTPPEEYLPWVASLPGSTLPVAQAVPGWTVTPTSIQDATGTARRPAVALTWDGSELVDVAAIMWQIRVKATLADVASGTVTDIQSGGIVVSEGLLASTTYQARGQLSANRQTDWTSWVDFTTLDLKISQDDLGSDVINRLDSTTLSTAKASLDAQVLAQLMQALMYTGDGRNVQLVALESLSQSADSQTKLVLLGALNGTSDAFVLNTSTVKVGDQTMAQYISGVQADIDDVSASVTVVSEVGQDNSGRLDTLEARYYVSVTADGNYGGIYLGVNQVGSTFGIAVDELIFQKPGDPSTSMVLLKYDDTNGFMFNDDVAIDGALVVSESITVDGIALGSITNTNFATNTSAADVDTASSHTVINTTLTTHSEDSSVEIFGILNFDANHGSTFYVDIYRDATLLHTIPQVQLLNIRNSWPIGFIDIAPPAGSHTYSIQMRVQTGADTVVGFLYRYLKVTEFKR